MPDLSTEPKMMRDQQDKDTPQHIDEDETRPAAARHDRDAQSAKAREAAKRGEEPFTEKQMEAILRQNRDGDASGAERQSDETLARNRQKSEIEGTGAAETGLAGKGRSRL